MTCDALTTVFPEDPAALGFWTGGFVLDNGTGGRNADDEDEEAGGGRNFSTWEYCDSTYAFPRPVTTGSGGVIPSSVSLPSSIFPKQCLWCGRKKNGNTLPFFFSCFPSIDFFGENLRLFVKCKKVSFLLLETHKLRNRNIGCFCVAKMPRGQQAAHTIILVQYTNSYQTRSYLDFPTVDAAMDGMQQLYY